MAMPAPSSILLMDPYRTALITMALEERLLTRPPMSAEQLATQKATFKMGEDKEIRATVLQQLLLFDDPLIIQNEERDTAEKHAAEGIIDLSLRNLHEENIVQFATGKIDIPDWGGEFAKCWSDIEDQLRVLRSWMVDQLMSRFYIGHPSVYDCWFEAQRRACVSARGEPVDDTPLHAALAAVPLEWRDQTREILENPNRVGAVLFLVLNRLGEAWQIGKIAEERQVYAAIPHLDVPHASGGTENTGVLFEIVIRELLADNIEFRLPTKLREARDLRRDPAVVSFRGCFLPWLESLKAGDAAAEGRLAKEVYLAAKTYKFSSIAKDISKWSTIASIALEAFGLQGVPAAASFGFDILTGRAKSKAEWVGLCGRERAKPLTQSEMAAADLRLQHARDRREIGTQA